MKNLRNLNYSDVTPIELEKLVHRGHQLRAEALASAFEVLKGQFKKYGSYLSAYGLSGPGTPSM
jgi:hypothetical protein